MEMYIQELKKQLVQTTAELENVQNEQMFLTEDLAEVTQKLENRTKLNQEKVEKYNKELAIVKAVNNQKQATRNRLTKKLNDLVQHQTILEAKIADWLKEQDRLKDKTKKITEDIEDQTRKLALVEKDFEIQTGANEVQKERLAKTAELYQNRKTQFEELITDREVELTKAEKNLEREIELNIELAKRYKVLQAQKLATKDTLAGYYETRVSLEDTKAWTNRIITMENKYYDKTTQYYILRDEAHKAEYNTLQKEATDHIEKISEIEDTLRNGFGHLVDFLDKTDSGVQQIEDNRRKSMYAKLESLKLPQIV
jgi:chromosome segregation ATPase